jgi:hypothetical protein
MNSFGSNLCVFVTLLFNCGIQVDENRCFPGRFEGGLLPGTDPLWPGLPR